MCCFIWVALVLLALNILMHMFGILILSIMTKLKNSKIFQTPNQRQIQMYSFKSVCFFRRERICKYVCTNGHLIKVAELRQYWKGNIYPERDRAVYEEHFVKANAWKRNLKLNQISDFWKPVVPFDYIQLELVGSYKIKELWANIAFHNSFLIFFFLMNCRYYLFLLLKYICVRSLCLLPFSRQIIYLFSLCGLIVMLSTPVVGKSSV